MKLKTRTTYLLLGLSLLSSSMIYGQDCNGGAITTKESYLYGRFEVAMQSAAGDGIVSSFFTYNIEVGCNWPEQNNEIDVEMTGNCDSVYFTSHHPGPWYYGENIQFDFNPHDTMQRYAFEWEPGHVRWFVGDELVYTQQGNPTNDLQYPMAILMNLWAADAVTWVGEWDPSILPRQSKYDYVKYYSYAPGEGNAGTDNNYKFEWEDNFDAFDDTRWNISDFASFDGNYCTFRLSNVDFVDGFLYLTIDEPVPDTEFVSVTFSVNMREHELNSSDLVYLNGTFNDWCGICEPMNNDDGIWSITLDLPPGKYEYLFTVNNWEEIGNAPIGSECDYSPCDEWANYGLLVSYGSPPIVLETYCWEECTDCQGIGVDQQTHNLERKLIKIYDLMGREVPYRKGKILLYYYNDGSVEKKVSFSERGEVIVH